MEKIGFDDLNGKLAVITGGAGIICRSMAMGLASVGVRTVILDLDESMAKEVAGTIRKETGAFSLGLKGNVLDKASLEESLAVIHDRAGSVDFLINGAGGNAPQATTRVEQLLPEQVNELETTFFGLDPEAFGRVFDLNFKGTLLPTMVFTRDMIQAGRGSVLNISSMNAFRPLTKIPAYSAAKASVNNFTQWLAVHFGKTGIRVNAIAPGFVLTNQNRFLLLDENTGNLLPRGQKIISGTPMGKFGTAEELIGATAFLLSDLSKFITGIVLPVDGGFNAYSGV